MEIYKEWLRDNGVKFEEKEYGLTFKYQGGYFILSNNKNDTQFLNLVMPGIFEMKDHPEVPREKILECLNRVNTTKKVVKALCDDEDCWLACEIFIDNTPDIEDFMERLLDILHQSRLDFFHYINN